MSTYPLPSFPSVSVIVVGYESRQYVDGCFASLLAQDYPAECELLFVDNQSTDGSVEHVRDHYPSVRTVETGDNLGYAGGNNAGAQVARGDLLVFLNPDTVAQPDMLQELVRPLLDDRTIGLTTAKIVHIDQPHLINTCGNDLSLTGITTCRRAGEASDAVTSDEEVTAVSGAAFCIRNELFRRLGGFDEHFWMYLEDTDLSWRARLAGFRCIVAARAVVAHHYRLQLSAAKTGQIERNRYRMLAKNLSAWALLACVPQLLVAEALTWGWALMRGPRHVWAKLLAVIWLVTHTWDLYRAHHGVQPLRLVSDTYLLRQHHPAPAVLSVATGVIGRLTAVTLTPILVLFATLTLAFLSVSEPWSTAASRWPIDDSGNTRPAGGGD